MALKKLLFITLCLLPLAVFALSVKPGTPDEYVVQKGDTLSLIGAKFLTNPGAWRDILAANPQIKNPHRLYPGQVIRFTGGTVAPRAADRALLGRNVRLSPSVRSTPLAAEATRIPVDIIQQFLFRPQVVDAETLAAAPEVIGNAEGRLLSGTNATVYVRGALPKASERFVLVRPRGSLQDPNDPKIVLAERSEYLGEGTLIRRGKVSELLLDKTVKEVLVGDKLLPLDSKTALREFYPVPAVDSMSGQIVDLVDALTQVAQYQIAVINLGSDAGVLEGTVFAVFHAPQRLTRPKDRREIVESPEVFSGKIMVFAVFPKISFALVTASRLPIHLGDQVRSPEAL